MTNGNEMEKKETKINFFLFHRMSESVMGTLCRDIIYISYVFRLPSLLHRPEVTRKREIYSAAALIHNNDEICGGCVPLLLLLLLFGVWAPAVKLEQLNVRTHHVSPQFLCAPKGVLVRSS